MADFPKWTKLLSRKTSRTPRDQRRMAYIAALGEPAHIFESEGPDSVEVLAFRRDYSLIDPAGLGYVLITNGMSDRRMAVPSKARAAVSGRAELVWYVREAEPSIVGSIRWLAEFPFIDETWLGFGHRVPMLSPPVSGSDFRTFLLLSPINRGDQRLAETLFVDEENIELLTVHLISGTEHEFIKTTGLDPFLDLLDQCGYPPVFNPARGSYV